MSGRLPFPGRRHRAPVEGPRLRDSAVRRRWQTLAALAVILVGLGVLGFGLYARTVPVPDPVRVDPDGVTTAPSVPFHQAGWALYGAVEDPRRPPTGDELGCRATGNLDLPAQPDDVTTLGSRVVDGTPVSGILLVGRPSDGAEITCRGASALEPLWLFPASQAPALTATSISIIGTGLGVVGLLVLPGVADLPATLRRRRELRRT